MMMCRIIAAGSLKSDCDLKAQDRMAHIYIRILGVCFSQQIKYYSTTFYLGQISILFGNLYHKKCGLIIVKIL